MKLIPLTKGKFAKVDDEDYKSLSKYKTSIYLGNYKQREITMHRMIMNTPKGMDTDHINHDSLDNRRSNLRICTHVENCHNSRYNKKRSLPIGVVFDNTGKKIKRYVARITNNKITYHLGHFLTPEEAGSVYQKAVIYYRGDSLTRPV